MKNKKQILWRDAFQKWIQKIEKKDGRSGDLCAAENDESIYTLGHLVSASRLQAQRSCLVARTDDRGTLRPVQARWITEVCAAAGVHLSIRGPGCRRGPC